MNYLPAALPRIPALSLTSLILLTSQVKDIKECILRVQTLYLKQLAAEDNHVQDVAKIPGVSTIEFGKNRKEVERVIETLWSQERTADPYSHGF